MIFYFSARWGFGVCPCRLSCGKNFQIVHCDAWRTYGIDGNVSEYPVNFVSNNRIKTTSRKCISYPIYLNKHEPVVNALLLLLRIITCKQQIWVWVESITNWTHFRFHFYSNDFYRIYTLRRQWWRLRWRLRWNGLWGWMCG